MAARHHLISMRAYNEEQRFLFPLFVCETVKRSRVDSSRRNRSWKHFIPVAGEGMRLEVCRTQFQRVFAIGNERLQKMQREKSSGLLSPKPDERGKQTENRPRRVKETIRQNAIDFVLDVIRKKGTVSHYRRRHAQGTIYLPHTMSIRHLWEGFMSNLRRGILPGPY